MEGEFLIPQEIADDEYLYRGVVAPLWDVTHNRPSSAVFKDSKGASVDRDALFRDSKTCVGALLNNKPFVAVCRVKESSVKEIEAVTKYKPIPENIYHCEIHDVEGKVSLSGKKPNRLRDLSEVVFHREG